MHAIMSKAAFHLNTNEEFNVLCPVEVPCKSICMDGKRSKYGKQIYGKKKKHITSTIHVGISKVRFDEK